MILHYSKPLYIHLQQHTPSHTFLYPLSSCYVAPRNLPAESNQNSHVPLAQTLTTQNSFQRPLSLWAPKTIKYRVRLQIIL